ncbi:uncharacterized protein LOC143289125 [Babylonia areolata]|uniref:uncharacterized protein LOC143289125 n=1 Tax=Babylonia areolata TaxID=304850 RepID=UPI003FD3E21B
MASTRSVAGVLLMGLLLVCLLSMSEGQAKRKKMGKPPKRRVAAIVKDLEKNVTTLWGKVEMLSQPVHVHVHGDSHLIDPHDHHHHQDHDDDDDDDHHHHHDYHVHHHHDHPCDPEEEEEDKDDDDEEESASEEDDSSEEVIVKPPMIGKAAAVIQPQNDKAAPRRKHGHHKKHRGKHHDKDFDPDIDDDDDRHRHGPPHHSPDHKHHKHQDPNMSHKHDPKMGHKHGHHDHEKGHCPHCQHRRKDPKHHPGHDKHGRHYAHHHDDLDDEYHHHHEGVHDGGHGTHVHIHLHAGDMGERMKRPQDLPPALPKEYRYAVCEVVGNPDVPGAHKISGSIMMRQMPEEPLEVKASLRGFPIDEKLDEDVRYLRGMHGHEFGDVSQNCKRQGGHYNPHGVNHGAPDAQTRHPGDFGNMVLEKDGSVDISFNDTRASLFGRYSLLGRGIVIHAGADDLGLKEDPGSKKSGNAGPRAACCSVVICPEQPGVWP